MNICIFCHWHTNPASAALGAASPSQDFRQHIQPRQAPPLRGCPHVSASRENNFQNYSFFARTAELTEAEELQMCVPEAQHRDAQCRASRLRRAVCTSSGVRLKRSSALMSAPFSRSHSDTLKEPSLAARCLRACHTAGWDGAH